MGLVLNSTISLILLIVSHCDLCRSEDSVLVSCPDGSFYDLTLGQCQLCTPCKANEISITTCSGTLDNQCGKYIDYVDFSFLNDIQARQNSTEKEKLLSPEVIQANEEEKQWKTLAFVLIGMISVLVVLATVIVIVSCHRFRNYQWLCKAVTTDQGVDDVENGYVVIHKFIPSVSISSSRPPSLTTQPSDDHMFVEYKGRNNRRFNGGYRPKRRMMNEYVDDVFESDDSAGSRVLPTIMEKPGESESSNVSLATP